MSAPEIYRHMTRNILRQVREATPDQREQGLEWYDVAFTICERLALTFGYSITEVACALAHLSPRQTWSKNVTLVQLLLAGEPRPPWALERSWMLASASLAMDDPHASFGRRALKTRAFAQAILGDHNAVVVDIWSARAAGASEFSVRSVTGYTQIADAYRRGARRVGLSPRDLQAVAWCAIRDGGS